MNRAILLSLLSAAPLAGGANEPVSYRYADAAYFNADVAGTEGDGYQLGGAFDVHRNVYLHGRYGAASVDEAAIDLTETLLGGGFRHGFSPNGDFIAELGQFRQEVEVAGFSESFSGWRASIGARGRLARSFEGWAKASYTGGDFDGTGSFQIGGQYRFTPHWGAVFELDKGEAAQDELAEDRNEYTKYMIGLRASF